MIIFKKVKSCESKTPGSQETHTRVTIYFLGIPIYTAIIEWQGGPV